MTTNTIGNNPSTTGLPHNSDGLLNKASAGAHRAVDSLAGAADDAARKSMPAIDRAAEKAHRSVNSAADAVAPTADWLTEQGEHLYEAQKKMVDDSCRYIAANPLKSAGFAMLAGYILSRFINR